MAERQAVKEALRNPVPSRPHLRRGSYQCDRIASPYLEKPKHAAQWGNTLATYAFPVVGEKPVDAITPHDVPGGARTHLDGQERNGYKVRQRMETVMDWGGHPWLPAGQPCWESPAESPAGDQTGEGTPSSLPYDQVSWALAQVRESTSNQLTKFAFEFLVLTAARSGKCGRPTGEKFCGRDALGRFRLTR